MKAKKKPVEIEVHQWFQNGDHPEDNATEIFDYPHVQKPQVIREGEIVRYYRHPDDDGERRCKKCEKIMHNHGWIDTDEGGHTVCPGDYIITGVRGEKYPCKPDVFHKTYDIIEEDEQIMIADALDVQDVIEKQNLNAHRLKKLAVKMADGLDDGESIEGKVLQQLCEEIIDACEEYK